MTSSYYDIDAILAEEELIPVTNVLNFSHLAHLDPDYIHHRPISPTTEQEYHDSSQNQDEDEIGRRKKEARARTRQQRMSQNYYLPEGTRFKMPLWSIENWAQLGWVRISLPRHFGRKARERLGSDPVSVNLRTKSERYFMSGMALVSLIQKCYDMAARSSKNSSRRNAQLTALASILNESKELKNTLLHTYTGARLRRTFDWTLSGMEDDVSSYTQRLTEMELGLFRKGAAAAQALAMWKLHGSRRIHVSETALRANALQTVDRISRSSSTTPRGGKRRGAVPNFVSPDVMTGNMKRSRVN